MHAGYDARLATIKVNKKQSSILHVKSIIKSSDRHVSLLSIAKSGLKIER